MGRKIWLFPLLAVMALCVGKAGCAKCALAEIFKNAKRGLFFLVSRLCPCPITLLVKSSQSSRKVVLCHDMSVVTRHCQCVRCLFLHVPQVLYMKRSLPIGGYDFIYSVTCFFIFIQIVSSCMAHK